MHTDIYNYASTDELISHLSKNDKIIGIVEYGTRKVNEMSWAEIIYLNIPRKGYLQ